MLANLTLFSLLIGCSPAGQDSLPLGRTISGGKGKSTLFVASGTCYAGGVATTAGSNTVVAFDVETGAYKRTVIDYNVFAPGDAPAAIAEYDADHMLVVVENASGRRVDLVRKDGTSVQTYLTNGTAFGGANLLRAIKRAVDGSLLISKSVAIEKFNSSKVRQLQGANPYVNNPAGACATSTTLISDVDLLSNGKILFVHAAATPNNKIVMVAASGYSVAGDCLAGVAAPTTTALPTALINHPQSGKWLVSFGSTTLASNFVYSYDVNATANTITGATVAFNDTSIVNGPSAMAVDPETGKVFVASGLSTFNTIDAFTWNGTALSRVGAAPFAGPSIYTRCVTSMSVMESP